MMKYPKIETLFKRGEDFRVDPDRFRRPEFQALDHWLVQEKVDGTNVRIGWHTGTRELFIGGRTDDAMMHCTLSEHLHRTFTKHKLAGQFAYDTGGVQVMLFGEGYGPKIQRGGNYRADVSFRLFDVLVGNVWLEPHTVDHIARDMEVWSVPLIDDRWWSTLEVIDFVRSRQFSRVAHQDGGCINPMGFPMEGVVARQPQGMLDRMGRRIMWKLKLKDFANE
jgi:hypothetical protein